MADYYRTGTVLIKIIYGFKIEHTEKVYSKQIYGGVALFY